MNKNQIQIIDCFTELIVYTLEFAQNAQKEIYTIQKLVDDYAKLIQRTQTNFNIEHVKFRDALFPVVAWIDETILNSQYKEKKLWRKELLQKKFFNTSNAGYEFFEKLEELEKDAYELRLLYLYCLFLGFQGRYYKPEDQKKLQEIYQEQKGFIQDSSLDHFPKYAFKKAYAQNQLPSRKSFKISYKGLWILVSLSVGIGLILFIISQNYLNSLVERYNIF